MWELNHKEGWEQEDVYFWTVVLEKTLERPLDNKEINPVDPKGNHPWIFIGRTDAKAPILWPPDVNSWLIGKDSDARKDWGQEEKEVTEDEMVGWHHQISGYELSKLCVMVKDRKLWHAAVHWVTKSWTWLSNWAKTFQDTEVCLEVGEGVWGWSRSPPNPSSCNSSEGALGYKEGVQVG